MRVVRRDDGSRVLSHVITVASIVVGVFLLFVVAPAVRRLVPLSDELDLASIVMPVWSFLEVCLLAGVLGLLRSKASSWTQRRRSLVASAVSIGLLLVGPSGISLAFVLIGPGPGALAKDPLQTTLLWSVPLIFYVLPAAIVAVPWARDASRPVSPQLAASLAAIGLLNIGAVYWFTHLWAVYVKQ